MAMGMMSSLMNSVVAGRIADVNPVKGYVQVTTEPMGTNRIVLVTDRTKLTKLVETTLGELKVGEEVTVTGVPLQLHASSLRVGRGLGMMEVMDAVRAAREAFEGPKAAPEADEGNEEPGAAEGERGADEGNDTAGSDESEGGEEAAAADAPDTALERKAVAVTPRRYPPPSADVSGVVESLDPLTIRVSEELKITISADPDAVLRRPVPATREDLTVETPLVAFGVADDDDYLQATELRLGETVDFRSFASAMGM